MKLTELTKTLLKKIILEELQLLQELVLADVKKRFQSKKFLKKFGEDKKEASEELLSLIPDGIHEKQKAEVLNWLISWAINTDMDKMYVHEIFKNNVKVFFDIKKANLDCFLETNALSKISSPAEFNEIVLQAQIPYKKYKEEKAQKSTKIDVNKSKVYEDKNWTVYIPVTQGASVKLGSPGWCTAARGDGNAYLRYHSPENPLIIFIPKRPRPSNEKYQFHYSNEEFRDQNDQDLSSVYNPKGLKKFYKLNNLIRTKEALRAVLPDSVLAKAELYDYKDLGGRFIL